MAAETGDPSPDLKSDLKPNMEPDLEPALKERLEKYPEAFSFFQTIRLLKRGVREGGIAAGALRIRPDLFLDYPSAEVSRIESRPEKGIETILTTFMGLYGISSPLPAFYTEDLMAAELEDQTTARALLDIIHQRLYEIFFAIQGKYRPLYGMVEAGSGNYPDILFSLLGLRDETLWSQAPDPYGLLRYIGLFAGDRRSALGLETLLLDAFPGIDVDVAQCVEHRVAIPPDQRLFLGGGAAGGLGVDAVLGQEVEDRTGKIAVTLGPLTRDRFYEMIDEGRQWAALIFLIRFYLMVPLECDLTFVLAPNEAHTVTLGDPNWSQLGRNAWTFSGAHDREVRSVMHLHLSYRPL